MTDSKIEVLARGRVVKQTLEAVIIRADGTREDIGVISSYTAPPLPGKDALCCPEEEPASEAIPTPEPKGILSTLVDSFSEAFRKVTE